MRCILVAACALVLSSNAIAQTFKMEPGPKSPAESLKCIQVRPGFTVELMAAEPLVMDPIAFAWGPDGKFWVVEMGDYPLGVDGKGKFGGKVKFLEKGPPLTPGPSPQGGEGRKPDGPYTKATTFLDNLGYPTGVTPWGKGVIVTCAPDIFYAEDTDGDGKADRKIILFTGFREGNQQHRVNGLVWGLDNWLYGANGDSGGVIKTGNALKRAADGSHTATIPQRKPAPGGVNISGRDFRLKPDTGEFEAVTGQTQFGRCRDDFGNWFGCNNSNPMFHFVLEDRYLKRNPHVLYPDPRVNVSVTPGAARVYPISKPLPRLNSPGAVNHFTSACSVMIYRDDLFGPEFYGNSFVSEPVHNLIHREVMKPKGVTFTSQRAADEQTSEFLASSDVWFRPTMIATGPDGALWVADMYRYVIEHPEWIPLDWQRKLELRAGHDLGRIYRIYPKDKTPRAIPRMDKMEAKELVKALESPNGWTRDTAQTLLVRSDRKEVNNDLVAAVGDGAKPVLARIHGMHALRFLWEDNLWPVVPGLLRDKDAAIRSHAIQMLDPIDRRGAPDIPSSIGNKIHESMANSSNDKSHVVSLQLAYRIGSWRWQNDVRKLLRDTGEDRYIFAAALSSVRQETWPLFIDSQLPSESLPDSLAPALIELSMAYGKPIDTARLMAAQLSSSKVREPAEQMMLLAGMLDVVEQSRAPLGDFLQTSRNQTLAAKIEEILGKARAVVADPKAAMGDKTLAIRLLGRGVNHTDEDRRLLSTLLTPQMSEDIQLAAVQRLGGVFDPRVPAQLIAPWKSLSPTLRSQVIDVLLARTEWTRMAIDALETKKILPAEIDTIRRQKLLDHRDPEIRKSAAKLFAASSHPDRAKLIDTYWITLPEKGDVATGSKLFAKHCAACHQLAGIGQQVGPDFAAIGDKSPQGLLTAILDPNRAVEARYVNYFAATKAGLTVSGLLQSETSTTITLVAADGKKHELLRKDLDELSSTGKSVMPEGFEKEIPPAAMADLLAFLRGNLAKAKTFPGNRPEVVTAGTEGSLKLLATNASIYGKTLVFEEKHKNLGYWSSPDDQASWTIDVPTAGRFDVWLDYACENGAAKNRFNLTIGNTVTSREVAGTASWDLYRRIKIATVMLPAGRHDVILRPDGAIRGALIDLKEIHLVPAARD